jgi:hypothetical protein
VTIGAIVLSSRSGKADVYPRIVIHKEPTGGTPLTFCEYVDGANNRLGVDRIDRVPSLKAAAGPLGVALDMGVGGHFACRGNQTGTPPATVTHVNVPHRSACTSDPAFYDVSVTLQFR